MYKLLEERYIDDIKAMAHIYRHNKSGARIFALTNDDENKVFSIGFRTPPTNDTGLPHILEHSVLCGSKNFPAKDPFVELVKGSLNTFLNAMTYPDKTVYPVASCNEKDFANLMHVYMDAVFYPNIYQREEIFKQEGWSYHLSSPDSEIIFNGVVYNEMKGAFSSPESILEREILHSLYPDTCYAHESGGDPEVIPSLTYEEFLDFHQKYYHPSNSFIYLYGDVDLQEKLSWLDQEYLSEFQTISIDSEVKLQPFFPQRVETQRFYPISAGEEEENNTYLSYNAVIATSLDKELYIAFQILEYALISMPGAPVKQALLDAGIGKDILSNYDNGIYQPFFSITAKNASSDQKQEFISVILKCLGEIVKNKVDPEALKAALNNFEFKFREADFGSTPKGLVYGLQAFDSWLYDEESPLMHLEALDTFVVLKEKIGTGYYEELIQKYLIENTHTSLVSLVPKRGLTTQAEKKERDTLKKYKDSLSVNDIQNLIKQTEELNEYKEIPSTREELEKIPLLKREDIKRQTEPFYNELIEENEYKILHHALETNGIVYIELLFDAGAIPETLIPYLGFLKSVLGYVDTDSYSYNRLSNEINMHTGGLATGTSLYANVSDPEDYTLTVDIRTKVLYANLDKAIHLLEEILFTSKFDDEKRLYEIVSEMKSRLKMGLDSSGNSAAALRAMSYYSDTAYIREKINGIDFYKFVDNIEKNFSTEKDALKNGIKELLDIVLTKKNLIVSITSSEEGIIQVKKSLQSCIEKIKNGKETGRIKISPLKKTGNEGFKTSAGIQYVARAGNYRKEGFSYTGILKVLRVLLNYEYLWNQVRVKGGAYGCGSNFTRTGDVYFASYRDPNISVTNDVYESIPEFLKNYQGEERDITKFVIGAISDIDQPLSPMAKGNRSLSAYMSKISIEQLEKEREEVLDVTIEQIRETAELIEAVLKQEHLCVIGNEDKIETEKNLFDKTIGLYE